MAEHTYGDKSDEGFAHFHLDGECDCICAQCTDGFDGPCICPFGCTCGEH